MKKNVLILGTTGMLGHTLFKYFFSKSDYNVVGTVRSKARLSDYFSYDELNRVNDGIDADNFDKVIEVFGKFKPDIVINCIGVIKQLKASKAPYISLNINSLFPHKLARLCQVCDCRLIHISTDCVFDGKTGNYTEENNSNAEDIYGKTKYLGEVSTYSNAVTLRTSIIGHELKTNLSLVDWFLSQDKEVNGFTKAIYTGFPTIEMAKIISDYVIPNKELNGLYHVSSNPINKYELLKLISKYYKRNIKIKPCDCFVLDRSLLSERFIKITGYKSPEWKELIKNMYQNFKSEECYRQKREVYNV